MRISRVTRQVALAVLVVTMLAGSAPAASAGTRCVFVNEHVICVDY